MTKQEYYDLLVRSARDGTFPSLMPAGKPDQGNGCAYRGEGKHKCAVGVLIPDELYTEALENNGVTLSTSPIVKLLKSHALLPEGIDFQDLDLIQEAHDDYARDWSARYFIQRINKLCCFNDVQQEEIV